MSEKSDGRTEQHTGPGDVPEAGEQAAGGKPGEEGRPEDATGQEEDDGKSRGITNAEATPEIGTEGNPGQTQVSGDPGEPPDEE